MLLCPYTGGIVRIYLFCFNLSTAKQLETNAYGGDDFNITGSKMEPVENYLLTLVIQFRHLVLFRESPKAETLFHVAYL